MEEQNLVFFHNFHIFKDLLYTWYNVENIEKRLQFSWHLQLFYLCKIFHGSQREQFSHGHGLTI